MAADPVAEHANLLLRWWAVIVAAVTVGAWAVRRGVVAPRAELARLSSDVADLKDAMDRNDHDHEAIGKQLESMSGRLDRLHDLILRLHTAHGIKEE